METDLKFRPFRSPADPGWDEAWAIYQNSFPQKEIRSLEDHLQALSDPHYTADGIWSDGRLIGILYYWTAPEYVYIEHLAISPDLRIVEIDGLGTVTVHEAATGARALESLDVGDVVQLRLALGSCAPCA